MMRHGWRILLLGLACAVGCSGGRDRELLGDPEPAPQASAAQETGGTSEAPAAEEWDGYAVPVDSLEMFSDLHFYGSWFDVYPYGWVWRPIVVSGWAPMTQGHWVWTIYGWMWVSYDPFGWATYNYGFWANDFTFGWVWVPTCEWWPVRCEWIGWDDYIGWSPLPPPGVRFRDPWERAEYDPWVVVPVAKFKNTDVARYEVPPKFKAGYSERSMRRQPPASDMIERTVGQTMPAVEINFSKTPYGSHELTRVVLPANEQVIVEQQRAKIKSKPAPPGNSGGSTGRGDSGNSESKGTVDKPAKQKATTPPPAKKESPPKFKEKNAKEKDAEEKKKDEDSKGDGKQKGR